MKKTGLLILGISLMFVACKEKEDVSVCTGLSFKESIVKVNVDESADISVTALPEGTVEYNNIYFTVLNDTVAEIEYSDNASCRVSGVRKGATILSASCGDAGAKAVINVYDSGEGDSERSVLDPEEDRWYLYTVSFVTESGCQSECFYKKKPYDYAVKSNYLVIPKENGSRLVVPLGNLLDLKFEECTDE